MKLFQEERMCKRRNILNSEDYITTRLKNTMNNSYLLQVFQTQLHQKWL